MEWGEMLAALAESLKGAANLPTALERNRAIAAAYETAAKNLGGETTAKTVLQQIFNSRADPGKTGDLVRLILSRAPEQTARQAITSSLTVSTTVEAGAGAAAEATKGVAAAAEATKDVAAGTKARGLLAVVQNVGRWVCRRVLGSAAATAVGGTAATVIGGVLLVGALTAVVYGLANLAGYLASDSPVEPSPALDRPQGEPAVPTPPSRQPEGNAAVPPTPPTGRPLGAWKLDKVFLYAEGKEQPGGSFKLWNNQKAPFERYDIVTPTGYARQGSTYEVAIDITPPPQLIDPGRVFEISLNGRYKDSEADRGWQAAIVDVLYHWRAKDTDSPERAAFDQMVAIKDGTTFTRAIIEVNPKKQSPYESFKLRAPSGEKSTLPLWLITFRAYNTPGVMISYQYRQLKPDER